MNPMQALLNAFVYRRWQSSGPSLVLPRILRKSIDSQPPQDERCPLLGSEPLRFQLSPIVARSSINTYATI